MKSILIGIIFISLFSAQNLCAQDMQQTVTKAVMKVPKVKKIIKVPEEWAKKQLKNLGIPESYVTTTIILAKPMIDGKISTKELNTGWKTSESSVLRPDFEYNFREGSSSSYLNWKINF